MKSVWVKDFKSNIYSVGGFRFRQRRCLDILICPLGEWMCVYTIGIDETLPLKEGYNEEILIDEVLELIYFSLDNEENFIDIS